MWDVVPFADISPLDDPIEIEQSKLTIQGHKKHINVVRYSPNDKMIASCSQDKTVKLWNASDLKPITVLQAHRKNVWDVTFSSHSRMLATCSGDKSVKVWQIDDAKKPKCVATLEGHSEQVSRVLWINFGQQLLSVSLDGTLKVWNLMKQACVFTRKQHEGKVWCIDVNETQALRLLSGGDDSSLKMCYDATKEIEKKQNEE